MAIAWIKKDEPVSVYKRDFPELWMEIYRIFPELGEARRATICNFVTETCPRCYSADRGCSCWNDE